MKKKENENVRDKKINGVLLSSLTYNMGGGRVCIYKNESKKKKKKK